MRKLDVKTKIWLSRACLLLLAIPLFCCCKKGGRSSGRVACIWQCSPVQVEGGYGYVVYCGNDTLIRQTRIPAVGHRRAFTSPDAAMQVGKLVCSKLQAGQLPTVSREEVEEIIK